MVDFYYDKKRSGTYAIGALREKIKKYHFTKKKAQHALDYWVNGLNVGRADLKDTIKSFYLKNFRDPPINIQIEITEPRAIEELIEITNAIIADLLVVSRKKIINVAILFIERYNIIPSWQ
jgi:hypothetical protein